MSEIPPTVNLCLLYYGNKKSLIHFPATAMFDSAVRNGCGKSHSEGSTLAPSTRDQRHTEFCGEDGKSKWLLQNPRKRHYSRVEQDSIQVKTCKFSDEDEVFGAKKVSDINIYSMKNDVRKTLRAHVTPRLSSNSSELKSTSSEDEFPSSPESPLAKTTHNIPSPDSTGSTSPTNFKRGGFKGRTSQRQNPWGSESYSELISKAIMSTQTCEATLQTIYEWIVNNIPYFADKADYPSTQGWKNAIRHTLSIRKRFTRIIDMSSPHSSLWTFSYRTRADRTLLTR